MQTTDVEVKAMLNNTRMNKLESQYENDVPIINLIQILLLNQKEHLSLVLDDFTLLFERKYKISSFDRQ